jgi:hypothetical protein
MRAGASELLETPPYETNAFRTEVAVHLLAPWIGGTFCAFSRAAISSSDIRFSSIALIFMRHP